MSGGGPPMPADFIHGWPPDDETWLRVRDQITQLEKSMDHPGRHSVVQVWRTNPISGYLVKATKLPD